jgi:hypothetical protein
MLVFINQVDAAAFQKRDRPNLWMVSSLLPAFCCGVVVAVTPSFPCLALRSAAKGLPLILFPLTVSVQLQQARR